MRPFHSFGTLYIRQAWWAGLALFQVFANIAAAGGRLIGNLGYILAVLGCGTATRGEKVAGGSRGTDSQDLATILDPFRVIFANLGPDRLSET